MPEPIDILISYAREDRPRVEPLAKAPEAKGWRVWWDPKIPPGRTWDDVIEEAVTKRSASVSCGPRLVDLS